MNFAPMVVNLMGFKINTMDRASVVSFGPVQQAGYYLSTKRNFGFGEENGDLSAVYLPINNVLDSDVVDSSSQKNSFV